MTRYHARYMNVPRMIDQLLERAGSRRFFARGETSEPHAPLGLEMIDAEKWAPGMWAAMKTANASDPAVYGARIFCANSRTLLLVLRPAPTNPLYGGGRSTPPVSSLPVALYFLGMYCLTTVRKFR